MWMVLSESTTSDSEAEETNERSFFLVPGVAKEKLFLINIIWNTSLLLRNRSIIHIPLI